VEESSASFSTLKVGAKGYQEMPVNLWQIARRLISADNNFHREPLRTAASVPVKTVLPFTSVCVSAKLVFETLLISKLVLIHSPCFSTGRRKI